MRNTKKVNEKHKKKPNEKHNWLTKPKARLINFSFQGRTVT